MPRRRKKPEARIRIVAMLLMGAGLVVIGAALSAIVFTRERPAAASADGPSVVPASVDFAAPALSLPNTSGNTESLTDYRGRVVLVNNWATWCPPCKAEMPTLQAYFEAHQSEGLTVIGIEAGESAAQVRAFAESIGVTFPMWVDTETASLAAFHNGSLPNSYVIDRTGTVRLAWIGEISRSMLEKHVTPLLSE
jgi:cytochrome c biogenesis protein CcmG/thiol:disulfide interchange protein DsbE